MYSFLYGIIGNMAVVVVSCGFWMGDNRAFAVAGGVYVGG